MFPLDEQGHTTLKMNLSLNLFKIYISCCCYYHPALLLKFTLSGSFFTFVVSHD